MSSEQLPEPYRRFKTKYPDVWDAYDALGRACHAEGPLDEKTRQLVKLAMAIGSRSEGAVHSHTRKRWGPAHRQMNCGRLSCWLSQP